MVLVDEELGAPFGSPGDFARSWDGPTDHIMSGSAEVRCTKRGEVVVTLLEDDVPVVLLFVSQESSSSPISTSKNPDK
ncbi:unnamed protein product, partial [Iphiclides podalirius]